MWGGSCSTYFESDVKMNVSAFILKHMLVSVLATFVREQPHSLRISGNTSYYGVCRADEPGVAKASGSGWERKPST